MHDRAPKMGGRMRRSRTRDWWRKPADPKPRWRDPAVRNRGTRPDQMGGRRMGAPKTSRCRFRRRGPDELLFVKAPRRRLRRGHWGLAGPGLLTDQKLSAHRRLRRGRTCASKQKNQRRRGCRRPTRSSRVRCRAWAAQRPPGRRKGGPTSYVYLLLKRRRETSRG